MMRSWSRSSTSRDEDDEDHDPSEAATATVPVAPVWPTSRTAPSTEDVEAPAFARRAPQPEPVSANDHEDDEPAPAPAAETSSTAEPVVPEPVAGPTGAVTQTLIFQAVPNFQAALALERSLKAMSEVREVRVADFDERQLTFQVTHELGAQLPRVLLTQRAGELEFVEARPERVEFVFRS